MNKTRYRTLTTYVSHFSSPPTHISTHDTLETMYVFLGPSYNLHITNTGDSSYLPSISLDLLLSYRSTILSVLSVALSCRRVASCPSRHARVRRCPAGSDTLAAELLRRRHVICRCRALLRLGWRRHRAACAFGAAATRADTRLPFFAKGAVASCYDGRGPSQAFTMHLRIETACAAGLCGPA